MAGEYDINLSNGNVLATLHPLETNGPDNTSTPRLIQEVRPSYLITGVVTGNKTFKINGDFTDVFRDTFTFEVEGSTGNDLTYTVDGNAVGLGSPATETLITVNEVIASAVVDGSIIAHIFRLNSDMSYRFISGLSFDVSAAAVSGGGSPSSPTIDGTYAVTAIGSFFNGATTVIPVAHGSIRNNNIAPIAVPYGQITYTVLDANTSLKLPGKGTPNYGEKIIEDLVRMVEHFASDTSPELNAVITGGLPAGDPLTGQLWYNTTVGSEGFNHWDGSAWTSDLGVASGSLIFNDIETGSPLIAGKIYITAAETNLPAPWMAGGSPALNLPGLVVWTDTDPAAGEPIFRVLSVDGNERLRVEHDGVVSTNNNLLVHGNATIEGSGINVNADTGLDARVVLDAPTGNNPSVDFEINNVAQGNIGADGTNIVINSATATNVAMVMGGGSVGIGEAVPSAKLDVVGTTELNGKTNVVSADFIVGIDGTGTEILSVDDSNSWVGIKTAIVDATDVTDAMEITGNLRINSQIFASDQNQSAPTFSFTNAPDTGMFYVPVGGSPIGSVLAFSVGGDKALAISSDGTVTVDTASYEDLVTTDNVLANKKYVDQTSGASSWREPVRVRDVTLYANQAAFPTSGVINGITLVDQDRVLFSNVTNTADKDVYVWTAAGTFWTKITLANPRTVGDTIYVQEGSNAESVYAYGVNGDWNLVGSGAGVNIRYEAIVATASQTVFNLSEGYSTGTNRLIVYVDGVKQTLYDVGSPTTSDYEETDASTVTFNQPVTLDSLVEFYAYDELTSHAATKRETQTGLTGTPLITFAALSYVVGSDNLLVYLNGQKANVDTDYVETSNTSITWVSPTLVATDVFEFYSSIPIVAGTKLGDIDDVTIQTPSDGQALTYNGTTSRWENSTVISSKPQYAEYLSQSGTGSPQTLDFATPSTGGTNDHGGTATLQVFVNGVYWIEGVNYTANVGSITLLAGSPNPIPAIFDLIIYEFA